MPFSSGTFCFRAFLFAFLFSVGAAVFAADFSPERFVQDARAQIGKTVFYDAAYVRLPYPMGDVPADRGVCSDVIIRALRRQGIDLQQRVHEDLRKNFSAYPSRWGMKSPDTNIDHRRVPNLRRYFERRAYAVHDGQFLPGDIVTWELRPNVGHIGIVSDRTALFGKTPLIIHNIGFGTQEENILRDYRITGHYRIKEQRRLK